MTWLQSLKNSLGIGDAGGERRPLMDAPAIQEADYQPVGKFTRLKTVAKGAMALSLFLSSGFKMAGANYAASDIAVSIGGSAAESGWWFLPIGVTSPPYAAGKILFSESSWVMGLDLYTEFLEKTATIDELMLSSAEWIGTEAGDPLTEPFSAESRDFDIGAGIAISSASVAAIGIGALVVTKALKERKHAQSEKMIQAYLTDNSGDRETVIQELESSIRYLKWQHLFEMCFNPISLSAVVGTVGMIPIRMMAETQQELNAMQTNLLTHYAIPAALVGAAANFFIAIGNKYSTDPRFRKFLAGMEITQAGLIELMTTSAFTLDFMGMTTVYILEHDVRKANPDDFSNALFGFYTALALTLGVVKTFDLTKKLKAAPTVDTLLAQLNVLKQEASDDPENPLPNEPVEAFESWDDIEDNDGARELEVAVLLPEAPLRLDPLRNSSSHSDSEPHALSSSSDALAVALPSELVEDSSSHSDSESPKVSSRSEPLPVLKKESSSAIDLDEEAFNALQNKSKDSSSSVLDLDKKSLEEEVNAPKSTPSTTSTSGADSESLGLDGLFKSPSDSESLGLHGLFKSSSDSESLGLHGLFKSSSSGSKSALSSEKTETLTQDDSSEATPPMKPKGQ